MAEERAEQAEKPASRLSSGALGSLGAGLDAGRRVAFLVMGGLVLLGLALVARGPRHEGARPDAAGLAANPTDPADPTIEAMALTSAAIPAAPAGAEATATPAPATPAPPPPPVFRVASLADDPSVVVATGTYGKHTFAGALAQTGLPKSEVRRVTRAFDAVHKLDHVGAHESYAIARDKTKNTVVAFEHIVSPTEIWQARDPDPERKGGELVVTKLEVHVERAAVAVAMTITDDLGKAARAAGLRDDAAQAIDDALESHVELAALKPGTRLRVVGEDERVDGAPPKFRVEAVEVAPKEGAASRVYAFEREGRTRAHLGFYDAKGQQPFRGVFRSPLPTARITSRFNPHRMHPVLHVVMPHNGIDFGATTGTPVYAAAAGDVQSAGNAGPCGNMIEIQHDNGLTTAYCHLKGFASGIHAGQHVEARQLIGYVGATGRVTGPHLHFAVKRNGVFIDPLGLKMDGVKVLPPSERDAFQKSRAELDVALDAIALPAADAAAKGAPPDDDKDEPSGEE